MGWLSGVNAIVLAAGLITGPITARALGVEGRGELAAITAVLTIAPWLLDLGLTYWLGRERARGVSRERLLGAALPIALISSSIGVAAAIPLSHLLGQDRPEVTTFIQIGLFLMPLSVVLTTLSGLAVGESRWGMVIASRLTGAILPTLAIVVLWLVGELTVTTGAAAYLIGAMVGMLIFVGAARGTGRLIFSLRRSIEATRFGLKSWLSTVAATANNRLDQVLMAGLVSSRELGLYAVAVTVTSVMHGVSGAVSNAQYPRVAAGDTGIAARTSRVTMGFATLGGGVLSAASPWLIPFVFGQPFADAVAMTVILLVASVPMAGAVVLSSALSAANNPAAAMRAELSALAFTIPALILFLPDHGALLAAGVSLIAYTIRLGVLLRPAGHTFAMRYREFLLPTWEDLSWVRDRLLGGTGR